MPLVQQRLQRWRRPMTWAGCACLSVCLGTLLLYFIARTFVREGERYIPPACIGDANNNAVLNGTAIPEALWMVRASSWFCYPSLGMINKYWISRAAAWRTAHCAVVPLSCSRRFWLHTGTRRLLRAAAIGPSLFAHGSVHPALPEPLPAIPEQPSPSKVQMKNLLQERGLLLPGPAPTGIRIIHPP
ncbi:uncharacterized protein PG986_011315 [Apiospora aurea]|uniref:Uncharacterized protein n=1 Tax=Apiospora aurea TaxID=335848 RepID=A0ABR1Q4P5_9PEZI